MMLEYGITADNQSLYAVLANGFVDIISGEAGTGLIHYGTIDKVEMGFHLGIRAVTTVNLYEELPRHIADENGRMTSLL